MKNPRTVALKRLAASVATTFVAVCTLLAVSGCARSTRCTVENRSASALTQVVVTGAGFAAPVPDLAPGATATVALRPRGEAGELTIVFIAEGREHRHVEPAYFEARGYSVHVTVDSRLAVTVQVEVAGMGRPSYG